MKARQCQRLNVDMWGISWPLEAEKTKGLIWIHDQYLVFYCSSARFCTSSKKLHLLTFQEILQKKDQLFCFYYFFLFLIRRSIRLKHTTSGLGEICLDLWPSCSVLELMCSCCPLQMIIRSPGYEPWQRLHLHWFIRALMIKTTVSSFVCSSRRRGVSTDFQSILFRNYDIYLVTSVKCREMCCLM